MSWTARRPLTGPDRLDDLIVPAPLAADALAGSWVALPGDAALGAPADPVADATPAAPADSGSIETGGASTTGSGRDVSPILADGTLLWAVAADGTLVPVVVVLTPDGKPTSADAGGRDQPDGTKPGGVTPDGTDPTDPVTADPTAGWVTSPGLDDGSWYWTPVAVDDPAGLMHGPYDPTTAADASFGTDGLTLWQPTADVSAGSHLPVLASMAGRSGADADATTPRVVYAGTVGSADGTDRVVRLVTPQDVLATTGTVTVTPAVSPGSPRIPDAVVVTAHWQTADDDLGPHPTNVTVTWDAVAGRDSVFRVTAVTDRVVLSGVVDLAGVRALLDAAAAAPPGSGPTTAPAVHTEVVAQPAVAGSAGLPAPSEASVPPVRPAAAEGSPGGVMVAPLPDTAGPAPAAAAVVAEAPAPVIPADSPTVPTTLTPSAGDLATVVIGDLLELPATLDPAEFRAGVGRWLAGLTADLTAPLDQPGTFRWSAGLSGAGAVGLYWWWRTRPPAQARLASHGTPPRPPFQTDD